MAMIGNITSNKEDTTDLVNALAIAEEKGLTDVAKSIKKKLMGDEKDEMVRTNMERGFPNGDTPGKQENNTTINNQTDTSGA